MHQFLTRPFLFLLLLVPIYLASCELKQTQISALPINTFATVNASFLGTSQHFSDFTLSWQGDSAENLSLKITHNTLQQSWQSKAGGAFVTAAFAHIEAHEFAGAFNVTENTDTECTSQSLDSWQSVSSGVEIIGKLQCAEEKIPYSLKIESANTQQLKLSLNFQDQRIGRTGLLFESHAEEHIFGLGEQFSFFDFKGKRVPILVSEQGLARGKQPLTALLNFFAQGSGGYWYTSYAPIPHFISSDLRSLALENPEFSLMDFRNPELIHSQSYSRNLKAQLLFGENPLALIEAYSNISGRMRALPAWSMDGVIIGLQGGTQKVLDSVANIHKAGGKVAAVWIQDWQGQRETPLGRRLWWNWELDKERYPNFESMKAELAKNDIRLMAYINPFLIDAEQKPKHQRNLYKEAIAGDYLLKNTRNELIFISQGSFKAYMVDFTKPQAREWYKGVIKTEILGKGFSGWMADFGEALPFDTEAYSGISAESLHNEYPTEWAKINREAIQEFGSENDSLFFMRSAFTRSPAHSTLFWLGDQATTWDNYDGIKTSITALLSSGLSGFAFNHGDVGGYFSVKLPLGISLLSITEHRSKELLMRWIELGAFQVVFRTHEGLLPDENAQYDNDEESLQHFARFSQIYRAWGFYRERLVEEAAETAAPVLRHPFLHFPQEKAFWQLSYQQYMIGEELWFAPVLDKNAQSVEIVLPQGTWVHAFTGNLYESTGTQNTITIPAALGTPAILYRKGSTVGEQFRLNLINQKLI